MENELSALKNQNEILKSQLMNTSLINELTKVMHLSTDPEGIIQTILLGIQEITEFERILLFSIDKENFSLKAQSWVGFKEDDKPEEISLSLGFDGGEITDAIFLNRHFIVENPDPSIDIFSEKFSSASYLVIPLISKPTRKCWEIKECNIQSCPARHGYDPYCWGIQDTAENKDLSSEDERRKKCVSCPAFKVEGVFWMDCPGKKSQISSDNITTLTTILNQAGIIIENFRMYTELENANYNLKTTNDQLKIVNKELREAQAKINKDLDHARTIQEGLLPQNIEAIEKLPIGAIYIPADAVGGDYYDVFPITPNLYGIVVADVSGHGVSSALIMSMVKVLLKTFASNQQSPQKTLEQINNIFLTEIQTDNFVTIFYAVLNIKTSTLYYTSAGHCPVLLLNKINKEIQQVKADGVFLGVFPDMMLKERNLNFQKGNYRLILYTDGLTEAKNSQDEMFDISRLQQIALQTLALNPRDAKNEIMKYQTNFCECDNKTYADDITLLVIDL